MASDVTVGELLAECATRIIDHGPDSPEVQAFIDQHQDNTEFVELSETCRALKRAFIAEGISRQR